MLLGVPRALDARAFGRARSVYVEVADPSPELAGFAEELSRALERAGRRLAPSRRGAATVVEVHALWPAGAGSGGPALSFTVRQGRRARPLVLHYPADRRTDAARALLAALDAPGS